MKGECTQMATYYYLAHHGIKGQKWGVRRYQNPDGTLTSEGKKRYAAIQKKYTNKYGQFSTTGSTVKNLLGTAGITYGGSAALGIGLRAAGLAAGGPIAVAGVLGLSALSVANIIRGSVQREKARRYIEVVGNEQQKTEAKTGRIVSGLVNYGPLGALVGAYMNSSHAGKIMSTKASDVVEESKKTKKVG